MSTRPSIRGSTRSGRAGACGKGIAGGAPADFLHTSSWMVHRPRGSQSRGRLGELVLFDRPQRLPRRGPDGLVTQITTPTPWRRAFLWRPVRAIEIRHGGTIVERWAWLRTVERRTHYGAARPDEVVEIRAPRPARD